MAEISFVLVEPETGGNIGAAARAIKTMGFTQLILVNPKGYPSDEAQYFAHNSQEILANARIVPDLVDLKSEFSLLIGTAKEGRHLRRDTISSRAVGPFVSQRTEPKIAVVFGRESSGLTNDELELCDLIVAVPLAVKEPSLNLGQAVMIMAYELSQNLQLSDEQIAWDLAQKQSSSKEYDHFKSRTETVLQKLGMNDGLKNYQQILGRIPLLSYADMRLLQHIYDRMQTYLWKDRSPSP